MDLRDCGKLVGEERQRHNKLEQTLAYMKTENNAVYTREPKPDYAA